ncbi:dimethylsulfonioproprionate lyase family protein [Roseovarius sp.]|uniref:dimethylsulfonioproprionate lyase family protein n=1 Tax=Roseovarius sp. TaxID=1486281 RepID=UPI002633A0A2|nr:dimethylsulfonioproprionate lyase family protein [Roseovarius sp.]MDM8167085.1 dimethylsulfonioproprionate lyase family protein [Roseovarius sp.]
MTDPADPADLLTRVLCQLRASHPDLVQRLAPGHWQVTPAGFAPAPACAHLPEAVAHCPETGPMADTARRLAALVHHLPWTADYPDHPVLKEAFAHAVIARSEGALLGCNLLAPHTAYPAHAHLACEIYLPVNDSGALFWQATTGADTPAIPGQPVIHGPSEPHALTTRDRPALNLWLQHGEAPGGPTWFT